MYVDPELVKAGQRLIDETNAELHSRGDLARRGAEKPLVVIAGPSKIAGGVSRVVKRPDGSSRVETWEAGIGWLPGEPHTMNSCPAPAPR